jgi:branched-subunit amino acid transport protein
MNSTIPATVASHATMHPPIRLGARHRRVVYASFSVLWLSGALWLLFHYFLQRPGNFGNEPHFLEQWWLRVHGLAMMATLVTAGSIVVHHARRAWQLHKNRLLGALLTGVLLWLAATGYALYYFSSDANQTWLPFLHWVPGLALPLAVALHVRRGQRRSRRRTVGDLQPSQVRPLHARPRALL